MPADLRTPSKARHILDMQIGDRRIDTTSCSDAVHRVMRWAERGESRYVCCATARSVMESFESPAFRDCMNGADLVTSRGVSLVWALQQLGVASATRVFGREFVPEVLRAADREGMQVGLYGGNPASLNRDCPGLVGYSFSPPSRELRPEEDQMVVDRINASGVQILLVCLGSPRQEQWIAAHKGRVRAVMIGVAAAFDGASGSASLGFIKARHAWAGYMKLHSRLAVQLAAQLLTLRLS